MSMVADLEAARARCVELEKEVATLKAAARTAAPAVPVSKTPLWDRFNAMTDPAERTRFYNANEAALKSEMKSNTERNG